VVGPWEVYWRKLRLHNRKLSHGSFQSWRESSSPSGGVDLLNIASHGKAENIPLVQFSGSSMCVHAASAQVNAGVVEESFPSDTAPGHSGYGKAS
jgi:hypothetical protein